MIYQWCWHHCMVQSQGPLRLSTQTILKLTVESDHEFVFRLNWFDSLNLNPLFSVWINKGPWHYSVLHALLYVLLCTPRLLLKSSVYTGIQLDSCPIFQIHNLGEDLRHEPNSKWYFKWDIRFNGIESPSCFLFNFIHSQVASLPSVSLFSRAYMQIA